MPLDWDFRDRGARIWVRAGRGPGRPCEMPTAGGPRWPSKYCPSTFTKNSVPGSRHPCCGTVRPPKPGDRLRRAVDVGTRRADRDARPPTTRPAHKLDDLLVGGLAWAAATGDTCRIEPAVHDVRTARVRLGRGRPRRGPDRPARRPGGPRPPAAEPARSALTRSRMDAELRALAAAHGVATWYEDTERRRIDVADDVVVAVLAQLGVDASTPKSVAAQLSDAIAQHGRTTVPDPLVLRAGETPAIGAPGELRLEDGTTRAVRARAAGRPAAGLAHARRRRAPTQRRGHPGRRCRRCRAAWGWMVQLYALHSAGSWGIGDLADLRTLVTGSARLGAGVVLVNPVQAITPVTPVAALAVLAVQPPLRQPAVPADHRHRAVPRRRRPTCARRSTALAPPAGAELIDYDAVWRPSSPRSSCCGAARCRSRPRRTTRTCATSRRSARWPSGTAPDWRTWPAELRHPRGAAVEAARRDNPRIGVPRVAAAAVPPSSWPRCAPRRAGMAVGDRARPAGRRGPRRRGRVGAAGRAGLRRHRRRAAGRVQPAGPGLEPAAVAARTGWPPPGTCPSATSSAACSPTPTASGSTT